jgi:hypothetical protein
MSIEKKGGENKVRVESLKKLPLVLGRETGRSVNVNPVNHAKPTRRLSQPRISGVSTARRNLLKGQSLFLPRNPGSIEALLDPPQVLHLRETESLGPRHSTRMPDRDQYWESCSPPLHNKAVQS